VICNFVVGLGAAAVRNADALTDFDRFDGVDTHDGLRQAAVETRIPAGVGTETERNTASNDFEGSADGVAVFLSFLDLTHHPLPPPEEPHTAPHCRAKRTGVGPMPHKPPRKPPPARGLSYATNRPTEKSGENLPPTRHRRRERLFRGRWTVPGCSLRRC